MSDLFISVIKGVLKSFMLVLFIIIGLSIVMLYIDITDEYLSYISVALLGITCYFGAYFSTLKHRHFGLLQGIICGAIVFTFVFLIGLIASSIRFSVLIPIKLAACLIFGIIGGIKGVNTKLTKV